MIIIGTGLAFTLFIIGLCYYGVILGALMFLTLTIFPFIFIIGSPWALYDDYKRSKKGEISPVTEADCVYTIASFCFGVWYLIDITIPFLQSL